MEYFLPLHHNLTFILYLHPYGCLLQVKLIFIGLPVRATTNEEMRSEFFYVKKRRNSEQNSQKALGIPLPFQWVNYGWCDILTILPTQYVSITT